ncbi:MAG: 3-hydroxybutyryl-CoA dehydrogenase [Hyphomicrobiales bacterium]|nr:3-hydroxybutyryl-CoA dehydrogenase [Hyphomicrobiales bacterium]
MTIKSVAIIGAGTMGAGIAITAAGAGMPVYLADISMDAIAAAQAGAAKFFTRQAEKGRLDAAGAEAATALVRGGTDLDPVSGADLVIEAVFEDLDIKAETFGRLNPLLSPDAVVATNTSCLRVADLAKSITDPSRFLGMHYFSPAAVNPLVEVVRGPETAAAVVDRVLAYCAATGKKALPCHDQNGFAVNRFFCPYTNEAARLVDEGVGTPAQIDRVAREALGVAAGPFFVMNIIKPRINLHAIRNLAPLGPFYAPADAMAKVGDAEESWDLGEDKVDPAADKKIAERLMAATFLPVLEELDEGVAAPEAIDMGADMALKFGKPPCALMDELGPDEVARLVEPLCAAHGVPVPKSLDRAGHLRAA